MLKAYCRSPVDKAFTVYDEYHREICVFLVILKKLIKADKKFFILFCNSEKLCEILKKLIKIIEKNREILKIEKS